MSEKSSFFNSVAGDRKSGADSFAAYFASFITNGVFPNPGTNLQVVSNSDMTVTVSIGKGWIAGYFYLNDAVLILPIDVADGVLKRIDRIALRMDVVDRSIVAVVKKGTFASSPVALALQRDADAYELALADVYVAAGVTSITGAAITDQRMNTALCGWVNSLIQADTTAIFDQYQAWFTAQSGAYVIDMAGNEADFQAQFDDWFATVQGQLAGDLGAILTTRVDTLEGVGWTTETVKGNADAIALRATFKHGSDTFASGGTTKVVTDAFITANTLVIVSPTQTKIGSWSVASAAGSFTITSDATETATVTFDWGATK